MVSLGTGTQWKSVSCPPTIHPSIPHSAIMAIGIMAPGGILWKRTGQCKNNSKSISTQVTNLAVYASTAHQLTKAPQKQREKQGTKWKDQHPRKQMNNLRG
jgi:hypothetical protein